MKITYDAIKNAKNIEERGLSFEHTKEIDWQNAIIIEDTRKDYGERRFRVFGFIDERMFVVIFTPRADVMNIISFRKANKKEVAQYG